MFFLLISDIIIYYSILYFSNCLSFFIICAFVKKNPCSQNDAAVAKDVSLSFDPSAKKTGTWAEFGSVYFCFSWSCGIKSALHPAKELIG